MRFIATDDSEPLPIRICESIPVAVRTRLSFHRTMSERFVHWSAGFQIETSSTLRGRLLDIGNTTGPGNAKSGFCPPPVTFGNSTAGNSAFSFGRGSDENSAARIRRFVRL